MMRPRIKVLMLITTSFVPYGGLTTVAMNYYRNIDHSMFQVDFASTNDCLQKLSEELTKSGSRYFKLPSRMRSPLLYMRKLYDISGKYDIVHIHGNSATTVLELLPAKLAGVKKRIVHIHNTKSDHPIAHTLLYPLMKYLMTDAVACSNAAGEWIFKNGNYNVLNNAIDLSKYSYNDVTRTQIRLEYGIDPDSFVIGHVGKFVEQKNHLFLIDVFSKVIEKNKNAKLMLVGDGPMRNNIEEKIKERKLNTQVVLCGMQENASKFLSAMDIVVFPSLWEGLPLSLLEAQANGLLCVASDVITSEVNRGGYNRYRYQKMPLYGLT